MALRILDEHAPRFDAADLPRRVAELEDVAGRALDREVLVDRPDLRLLGPLHHGVRVVVGNRAARLDRGHARAAPAAQHAGDAIAMDVRADAAAAIADAFAQHHEDLVEVRVGQLRVRRGAAHERRHLRFGHLFGRARRDDLLREDVERRVAQRDRVEVAATDAAHERRALEQLVARHREQAPLGGPPEVVARAADALQQRRDRARRAELHDEIDRADVDAELERRGRDRDLALAVLELLLRRQPQRARHRAVVRDDVLFADALLERRRDALDQPPRVDEHDRRAMLAHERGDAIVDPAELLVRRDRAELVIGDLDREVEIAAMAGVDDVRHRAARADQQARDDLDRPLRRREPHAHGRRAARLRDEAIEPLERQREVTAALVAGNRVDLVDDHRAHAAERRAPALARELDEQRLGRRDQDVRRMLRQLGALRRRRVTGAHRDLDVRKPDSFAGGARAQLGERLLEVALDIVRQRLERRDVQDLDAVAQRCLQAAADQRVEAREERRERLAGSGRRRDQDIFARGDARPARSLRRGRRAEPRAEPARDERVKRGDDIAGRGSIDGRGFGGIARHGSPLDYQSAGSPSPGEISTDAAVSAQRSAARSLV